MLVHPITLTSTFRIEAHEKSEESPDALCL
jgi:hypothetical protein